MDINIEALVEFIAQNHIVQALVNSSSNSFFHVTSRCNNDDDDPTTSSSQQQNYGIYVNDNDDGAWSSLPAEWRAYFQRSLRKGEAERELLLQELANGRIKDDCIIPSTLASFLSSCRTLSFDRTRSTSTPLLSSATSSTAPLPPPRRRSVQLISSTPKKRKNEVFAGLSPKKHHEVESCVELVRRLQLSEMVTHCIDVGSGRAHLSRALAQQGLHVLAVDSSHSQLMGATKLDSITSTVDIRTAGSLEHRTTFLDTASMVGLIDSWPASTTAEEKEGQLTTIVVGLHCCGDLSVNALRAYLGAERDMSRRSLMMVGCCYNLLSRSNFPLSNRISSLESSSSQNSFSTFSVALQSPPNWYRDPSSTSQTALSIRKIAFRSRLAAELALHRPKDHRSLIVGRIRAVPPLYEDYRRVALGRIGIDAAALPIIALGTSWSDSLFLLRCYWTLRGLVAPVIETLIVLDRYLMLVEQIGESSKQSVEVYNLFDQALSLRNLALVVRSTSIPSS